MNIIVTGASKGIGFETVLHLNKDTQNRIFAIARDKILLSRLKENGEHPENIHPFAFDFKKYALYKTVLLGEIMDWGNKIDVLINNAGFLINKPYEQQTFEDFDLQVEVNFKTPFFITQLLLPLFNPGAHVLNISSMGGFQGSAKFPGLSVYSASKAALAVLTESMAEEFKSKQIKANCLALGAIQTEMLSEAFPGYKAPLTAAEMGKYIAGFALNGHHYFNGKILPVALSTP